MVAVILILMGLTFAVDNHEFFDTAAKQMDEGAEWHYVGYK